jgi:hypothetical protein
LDVRPKEDRLLTALEEKVDLAVQDLKRLESHGMPSFLEGAPW